MINAAAIDAWAVDALGLPYNDPTPNVDSFPTAAPPGAPTSLIATAGDQQVSVAFTAAAANDFPVQDYEVSVDSGDWFLAADKTSPIVVTGLTNGDEVSIRLRAVSEAGRSAASSPVTATPAGVPLAPTELVATAGDTEASIAFTAGGSNGSAITNYKYRVGDGAWTAFDPADTTSPVVVTGLANDEEVSITLRAVNAVGDGAISEAVTVTPTAA